MRFTWGGTAQYVLLWIVRTAVTATALWLWWMGRATPGEITYVLTMYFVVHGYLRDVGQHVQQLQRGVNEMEELVNLFDEPAGVADVPDARPLHIRAGEVRFEHVTFQYAGQGTPLYRDLNVRIAGGERIGLVGRSGLGQDDVREADPAAVRRFRRPDPDRRPERFARHAGVVALADRDRAAGARSCFTARSRRTSPMRGPMRRRPRSSTRRGWPTRTSSSRVCPASTRRWWASAA